MMKRLWFICLLIVLSYQLLHQSKIFLVQGESSIFFPHRQLQLIPISSSQCSSKQADIITYRPLMQTLTRIAFNNTNQGISIFQDNLDSDSMKFYYAKINLHGICSVYLVEGEIIRILYQYDFGDQFTNVIVLNQFHTFLWNCKSFAVMQYSQFTRSVVVLRKQFSIESGRNCKKYSSTGLICWGQDDIVDIKLQENNLSTKVYYWQYETIKFILYLDIQLKIIYICSFTDCKIAKLLSNNTIEIIHDLPFVQQILGGDSNTNTKQLVLIHSSTAIVLAYNPLAFELNLVESIDFYEEFSCVFIENVRLLSDQILVNCNNFMGQAKHLVIMRDDEINRDFAYQPIKNADPNNPCLFDGNDKYIFAVCKTEILTKFNNFQYFSISHEAEGNMIIIQCIDTNSDAVKLTQAFLITIQKAQYQHAYANQQIILPEKINYDDSISLRLRKSFTANAIQSYSITSPQCPFITELKFDIIRNLNFFSLFILQNCVQIVSSDSQDFYRVIQISRTVYYIELCQKVKMDHYGCQLEEIIEGFEQLRIIFFYNKKYKLYLYEGNLIIDSQIQKLILFRNVSFYQIRNQVLRVLSGSKYYSKPIQNAIFGSGGWIQQISDAIYRYSQGSIFELRQNGVIFHYKDTQKAAKLSIEYKNMGNNLKQSIFPFIQVKGFFTFIINQTHISKNYNRQTIIIIYQMPYNIQNYEISEIKSVDNYITIQYTLGFFQVYDIERSAVQALIAVQQEEVLCDIMLVDKGVILVPIKYQPYIIAIDTDPTVNFRGSEAIYSKFREKCPMIISPHMSNGSCPNEEEERVNQTIQTIITFDIQKITLSDHIIIQQQPSECSDCIFQLNELNFKGPIFTYQINDDYYGAFEMTSHLNIKDCTSQKIQHLTNMQELHMAQDNMRSQALLINKTHLVVVDERLKELYKLQFSNEYICVSYTVIEQYYLVLCNDIFILFNKDNTTIYINHDLPIGDSSSSLENYFIHSELIIDSKYHIYILSSKTMLKYVLNISSKSLCFLSSQQYTSKIFDFTIVGNRLITLQNRLLCISASSKGENSCYSMQEIIPYNYAKDYSYHDLAAYHSTETSLRALLVSKTNDNLHIDLQINLEKSPAQFRVLNAYVGYTGFIAKSIVMINSSKTGNYSSFVLYYESQGGDPQDSSFIAYYPFNNNFKTKGQLGQIRSAIFLTSELQAAYSFTFFSFTQRFYVASLPPLLSLKRKKCIQVTVEPKLIIKSTYDSPPLMQFLIVKIKNINDLQPLYIKIVYLPEQILLVNGLIGLGVIIVLFVALVIATNRCKEENSDLMIHFMSEDIEKEFSESEDNSSNDLLHSKTSPSSPRSLQPSNQDYQ